MPKNVTMRMSHRNAWHATEWIIRNPSLPPPPARKPPATGDRAPGLG